MATKWPPLGHPHPTYENMTVVESGECEARRDAVLADSGITLQDWLDWLDSDRGGCYSRCCVEWWEGPPWDTMTRENWSELERLTWLLDLRLGGR